MPPVDSPAPARALHLLLVEDHEDTAEMTREYLEMLGHTVCTAASVARAREAAKSAAFDVLICDLGLPDGSGVDALNAIRQVGCSAPAIALSGHGTDEHRAETSAAGFAEHMIKPVDVRDLEAVVRRLAVP
jgi:two-component system CheB/CheR fusion protein